jgi:hypothetical protein
VNLASEDGELGRKERRVLCKASLSRRRVVRARCLEEERSPQSRMLSR